MHPSTIANAIIALNNTTLVATYSPVEGMTTTTTTKAATATATENEVVEDVCDICCSELSEEGNELLLCDGCNVGVHRGCLGLVDVPEGEWFCESCQRTRTGQPAPACRLCLRGGGILRPLADVHGKPSDLFAHQFCAQVRG